MDHPGNRRAHRRRCHQQLRELKFADNPGGRYEHQPAAHDPDGRAISRRKSRASVIWRTEIGTLRGHHGQPTHKLRVRIERREGLRRQTVDDIPSAQPDHGPHVHNALRASGRSRRLQRQQQLDTRVQRPRPTLVRRDPNDGHCSAESATSRGSGFLQSRRGRAVLLNPSLHRELLRRQRLRRTMRRQRMEPQRRPKRSLLRPRRRVLALRIRIG